MDYGFRKEDLINHRERFNPGRKLEPVLDTIATEIVKQPVYTTDPRLLKVVAKFKQAKKDPDAPDNFLQNPKFIEELKKAFSQPL